GLTHSLIGKAEEVLVARGVAASLMVVRGAGALMSAQQAKERPIETILSGPAASIVGARWLTGVETALVSDIGGTTTDIALLRDGKRARVGRYRTMVEAVAMGTHGLGGDSAVRMQDGLRRGVDLGPERVVPLSMLAHDDPRVIAHLEAQLRGPAPGEYDGKFVRQVLFNIPGLDGREAKVLNRIDGIMPLSSVLRARVETQALDRLRARGIVQIGGVTPTDASHVLGYSSAFDTEAARLGLTLMARRRAGDGMPLADTPEGMARLIEAELHRRTGVALIEAALSEEPLDESAPQDLAEHILMTCAFAQHSGLLKLSAVVSVPVVGLGASASTYYPEVGRHLGTEMLLPEHGGVANAIGAVVGRITMRRSGTVTSPSEGLYRAHMPGGPSDFSTSEAAINAMSEALSSEAEAAALVAGAAEVDVTVALDVRKAQIESREVFVEAELRVEASGRARVARL
ncbi:MAG: hydantoinase/oxoprolinase family protein, partial [Marinovum sp.]|nr:hydantoinase/oxoprolinase family protein [Marinovum sp.]